MKVSKKLVDNIKFLDEVFKDCGDIVKRKFVLGKKDKIDIYITYVDMLTSRELIEDHFIKKIISDTEIVSNEDGTLKKNIFSALKEDGLATADLKESESFLEIQQGILSGDTVLFVDGYEKVVIISTKGFPNRGIPTTETEIVLQGSKEAFSEVFRFNTALIRRRIRDTNLKLIQIKVGTKSQHDVG